MEYKWFLSNDNTGKFDGPVNPPLELFQKIPN